MFPGDVSLHFGNDGNFDKVDTNNGEEIRYSVIALLAGKWFSVSFIEVWKLTFIVFEIMKNARKNYLSDDN